MTENATTLTALILLCFANVSVQESSKCPSAKARDDDDDDDDDDDLES